LNNALSLYIPGKSRFHELNPLTKLTIAVSLIAVGFLIPWLATGYVLFLLVVVPISVTAGIVKQITRTSLRITLPFALSIFLIQGFFWGSGEVLFSIGPLDYRYLGLLFSIESVGNILLIVGSFLLLSMTTRPDALMLSLSQLGMPNAITYIVVTTIQIAPYFQTRADKILDAQRSRGLQTEGNLMTRVKAFFPLILPLVLSSLLDVEERAIAIEARAFNSPTKKTSLLLINDQPLERIARWTLVVVVFLCVFARIWLW
jgi:energy-coupling factor transport system permease protein